MSISRKTTKSLVATLVLAAALTAMPCHTAEFHPVTGLLQKSEKRPSPACRVGKGNTFPTPLIKQSLSPAALSAPYSTRQAGSPGLLRWLTAAFFAMSSLPVAGAGEAEPITREVRELFPSNNDYFFEDVNIANRHGSTGLDYIKVASTNIACSPGWPPLYDQLPEPELRPSLGEPAPISPASDLIPFEEINTCPDPGYFLPNLIACHAYAFERFKEGTSRPRLKYTAGCKRARHEMGSAFSLEDFIRIAKDVNARNKQGSSLISFVSVAAPDVYSRIMNFELMLLEGLRVEEADHLQVIAQTIFHDVYTEPKSSWAMKAAAFLSWRLSELHGLKKKMELLGDEDPFDSLSRLLVAMNSYRELSDMMSRYEEAGEKVFEANQKAIRGLDQKKSLAVLDRLMGCTG